MSEKTSAKASGTDWTALRDMPDDDIQYDEHTPYDPNDPAAVDAFWRNATVRYPEPKEKIAIRIDADVLAWFKARGAGWQTRMNAVLKAYMEAQRR